MKLSAKQRKYLKGLGHHLKPIIQIGKDGVSKQFVANLDDCLEHHELIKVKVLDNAPDEKAELAVQIEKKSRVAWPRLSARHCFSTGRLRKNRRSSCQADTTIKKSKKLSSANTDKI